MQKLSLGDFLSFPSPLATDSATADSPILTWLLTRLTNRFHQCLGVCLCACITMVAAASPPLWGGVKGEDWCGVCGKLAAAVNGREEGGITV